MNLHSLMYFYSQLLLHDCLLERDHYGKKKDSVHSCTVLKSWGKHSGTRLIASF